MVALTKPGGIIAFTCASTGRPEHGTVRSDPSLSPGTQSRQINYYGNLTELDFIQSFNLQDYFYDYLFFYNPTSWDLYFMGVKKGKQRDENDICILPSAELIRQHTNEMSLPHRLIRLPLRFLLKFLSIRIYNRIAYKYWKLIIFISKIV